MYANDVSQDVLKEAQVAAATIRRRINRLLHGVDSPERLDWHGNVANEAPHRCRCEAEIDATLKALGRRCIEMHARWDREEEEELAARAV